MVSIRRGDADRRADVGGPDFTLGADLGPALAARAARYHALARTSRALLAASSVQELLEVLTDAAREIIGAHQAVATRTTNGGNTTSSHVSLSDKYERWRDYAASPWSTVLDRHVVARRTPLRLDELTLAEYPEWREFAEEADGPPIPNYLAVPLLGLDDEVLGLIQLADKEGASAFTAEDEASLLELAGLAAAALRNIEALDLERDLRGDLEREAHRAALLADLSRRFSDSLVRDDVLDAIAEACIPAFSDVVAVHLVSDPPARAQESADTPAGGIELARLAHREPGQEELVRDLLDQHPARLDGVVGVGAVIRTGEPQFFPRITSGLLRTFATDDVDDERLEALDLAWAYILPLTARGQPIGTITFGRGEARGHRVLDTQFGEELARRAALALEHAQAFESQRRAADEQRRLLTRLELALETNKVGTWDWDLQTETVTWSPTLEEIYGFAPGTFPGTFEAYLGQIHPADRVDAAASVDAAIASGERFRYSYRILRADGEIRWIEGAGQAVHDDGELVGMTGVCQDITERRRAEMQLLREHILVEAVSRVGQAVTANLDLRDVLHTVTAAASSLTDARVGLLWYDASEGPIHEIVLNGNGGGDGGHDATDHSEPSRSSLEATLVPAAAALFDRLTGNSGVLRIDDVRAPSGTPGPIGEATLDTAETAETADAAEAGGDLADAAPEVVRSFLSSELPLRSLLAVPVLGDGGQVCGGLLLGHDAPDHFSEHDDQLLAGIASQAGIAIDNARLYEAARAESEARQQALDELQEVARALQQSLLPPHLPELPGLELAARYFPAGSGIEVGGDFYDVFQSDETTWHLAIGDVCGKGPEAAALTGLTRHVLRSAALRHEAPAACLRLLNQALQQEATHRFVTVAHLMLDLTDEGVRCTVSLGGHPHPLLIREGTVQRVGRPGTLLGIYDEPNVRPVLVDLRPGDVLLAYTDGVTDQPGGYAFDGVAFERFLVEHAGQRPEELLCDLEKELVHQAGDSGHTDDIALVALGLPSAPA